MTVADERAARDAGLRGRIAGARVVLLAAAAVLVFFAATGALSFIAATIGFVVIVAAALAAEATRPRAASPLPALPRSDTSIAIGLIDTMLAGLPDPVVALDRDGLVIAFNTQASALAPGLRRGEPASLALRMPEIITAIRQAIASGEPQRVEFSERVPIDRWYEAHVSALHVQGSATDARPDLVLMAVRDLTPLR